MNKKSIVTVLQVLATVAILGWLFRDPVQNQKMWQALMMADVRWIAVAVVLYVVIQILGIARWQVLLRIQGVRLSWLRLTSLVMIGAFFNPFMPGGVGGDVVKIFYLLKEVGEKKSAALLAVLMDRVVGLFGLISIAAIMIWFRFDFLTQTKVTSGLLFVLLAIFAGSFAFIGVSYVITLFGLVHKLPARMPLRAQMVELSVAYTAYGKAWRFTLLALAVSIPVHIGSFSMFYCVYRAFSLDGSMVPVFDFWAIMPIVGTIAAMPVSIGGAGVREGLFINLLGDLCRIPEATAVIISLTGFSVQLFWGLVGGIVYLFYRPSEQAEEKQVETGTAVAEG